jgi:hypothetical protein
MVPKGPECQHQRTESREHHENACGRVHAAAVIV